MAAITLAPCPLNKMSQVRGSVNRFRRIDDGRLDRRKVDGPTIPETRIAH